MRSTPFWRPLCRCWKALPSLGRARALSQIQRGYLHEVAGDILGPAVPTAVVTGPSFAVEVAQDLPTAVTVASDDSVFAGRLAGMLHSGSMRAYTSGDIVGAELGGAVKNVLAIATGVGDGMGLGLNARAALVTRGAGRNHAFGNGDGRPT